VWNVAEDGGWGRRWVAGSGSAGLEDGAARGNAGLEDGAAMGWRTGQRGGAPDWRRGHRTADRERICDGDLGGGGIYRCGFGSGVGIQPLAGRQQELSPSRPTLPTCITQLAPD
jgi:hypothetical protein